MAAEMCEQEAPLPCDNLLIVWRKRGRRRGTKMVPRKKHGFQYLVACLCISSNQDPLLNSLLTKLDFFLMPTPLNSFRIRDFVFNTGYCLVSLHSQAIRVSLTFSVAFTSTHFSKLIFQVQQFVYTVPLWQMWLNQPSQWIVFQCVMVISRHNNSQCLSFQGVYF